MSVWHVTDDGNLEHSGKVMHVRCLQSEMIVFASYVPGMDRGVHVTREAGELHLASGARATGEFENRCETVTTC